MWIRIRVSSWRMSVISSSLTATSEGRTPIRDWRSPGIYLAASISPSFSLLSSSWSSEIFIGWCHEYADTRNSFKAKRMNLYPPKGLIFIPGRPVRNTRYQPPRPTNTQTHWMWQNVFNSRRKISDIDYFSFPCFDELKTCTSVPVGYKTAQLQTGDVIWGYSVSRQANFPVVSCFPWNRMSCNDFTIISSLALSYPTGSETALFWYVKTWGRKIDTKIVCAILIRTLCRFIKQIKYSVIFT